ncbi:UNVERIFIED_ORG: Zeta toxin [Bacillus sp. AZ43]
MELDQVLDAPIPTEGGDAVLVVIGGLPGSGKTTLLRRLLAERAAGVAGLDSEQVAERLRRAGIGLPYRYLRPWVHLLHRVRVLGRIGGRTPVVVLTDPWTDPRWRRAVLGAAARAGRRVRLVWIDASPEVAAGGQSARGRAISGRAMRRHVQRALHQHPAGAAADALVVDRGRAARLTLVGVLGPR